MVVGAINKFNNWNRDNMTYADAQVILNRAADQLVCPRLKNAKILNQWTGLRPYRLDGVRLEPEVVKLKGGAELNVNIRFHEFFSGKNNK